MMQRSTLKSEGVDSTSLKIGMTTRWHAPAKAPGDSLFVSSGNTAPVSERRRGGAILFKTVLAMGGAAGPRIAAGLARPSASHGAIQNPTNVRELVLYCPPSYVRMGVLMAALGLAGVEFCMIEGREDSRATVCVCPVIECSREARARKFV